MRSRRLGQCSGMALDRTSSTLSGVESRVPRSGASHRVRCHLDRAVGLPGRPPCMVRGADAGTCGRGAGGVRAAHRPSRGEGAFRAVACRLVDSGRFLRGGRRTWVQHVVTQGFGTPWTLGVYSHSSTSRYWSRHRCASSSVSAADLLPTRADALVWASVLSHEAGERGTQSAQLEEEDARDRVLVVALDLPEAERQIERPRGVHRRQRVEPHRRVAELPRPGDRRLHQRPAEARASLRPGGRRAASSRTRRPRAAVARRSRRPPRRRARGGSRRSRPVALRARPRGR